MQEFFNNLDNWTIIKIFGGISVVISAIVVFLSGLLKSFLSSRWQGKQYQKIEELRHELDRREKLLDELTDIIPKLHMATNDRRLDHLGKLWDSMIKIRKIFPTLCGLIYTILSKTEIENLPKTDRRSFRELISSFDPNQYFTFHEEIVGAIEHSRPFVGAHAWNTFFAYQALHGRLIYLTSDGLKKGKIKFWLDDESFVEQVIGIAVKKDAMDLLFQNEMMAYQNLVNHLELELANEINSNLLGHAVAQETVKHAIEISEAVKSAENADTRGKV